MQRNEQAGQVEIRDNRATVTFTRFLKHPPAIVWEALTTPEEFSAWYTATLAIDGRVGGMFEVFAGPFHWQGPILVWEPPYLLEYEYNLAPHKLMPLGEETVVRWELQPSEEGTILTFTQTRLKSTFGFAPAMHVFLERLNAYLSHDPIPDFLQCFQQVKRLYLFWKAEELTPP